MTSHKIRKGETLQSIAADYGCTVRELMTANGLPKPVARAGRVLVIPVDSTATLDGTDGDDSPGYATPITRGDDGIEEVTVKGHAGIDWLKPPYLYMVLAAAALVGYVAFSDHKR